MNLIPVRHSLTIALGFAVFVFAVWWVMGTAWSGTEQAQGESQPPDHPLVVGRLKGEAQHRRLRAFIEAERVMPKGEEDRRRLYRAFLEDLGVARIGRYLEGRSRFCHAEAHELGMVALGCSPSNAVSVTTP